TILRPLPRSPLFPYTTLFRSTIRAAAAGICAGDNSTSARRAAAAVPTRYSPRARARHQKAKTQPRHGASRILQITTEATHEPARSEEHTSELQSQSNLVCRLL